MEKYIGSYCLCNNGAVAIKTLDDERVTYDIVSDRVLSKHNVKLFCDRNGDFYFHFGRMKIYLNECMKL